MVPVFQYVGGRQCTSWSLIQCHAPTTCGDVVTDSRFSTAARIEVGTTWSNVTTTGEPTPTVSPAPGESSASMCFLLSVVASCQVRVAWWPPRST